MLKRTRQAPPVPSAAELAEVAASIFGLQVVEFLRKGQIAGKLAA
jgi:hypothetical protein